jgi:hypothetical protein
MNAARARKWEPWVTLAALAVLLAGCATPHIDWASRVGGYTYDQAVLDIGPPDKYAKLSDNTVVAEWLTHRGYSYAPAPFAYAYSGFYGPYYTAYYGTITTPDYFLRLTFGPDGQLKAWKKFYR